MKTIRDLFVHELVDLRNAAQAFHGVLQRMASVATHPEVRSLLEAYFYQSEYQEKNLRSYLTEQAVVGEEKCSVAQALCEHALESIRFDGSAKIRDVALLVSANRIQHFEITALGTALSHAELLELEEEIDLHYFRAKSIIRIRRIGGSQIPQEIVLQSTVKSGTSTA